MMRTRRARLGAAAFVLLSSAVLGAGEAAAQAGQTIPVLPLSQVPVPTPTTLGVYVKDIRSAQILGKALFWDMQVGSDGVQACASCHFRAGADSRRKNQVSPGLLRVVFQEVDGVMTPVPAADLSFGAQGPNGTLSLEDFPFRALANIQDRESAFTDSNNVVSSQGVHYAIFGQSGYPGPDPDGFHVGSGRRQANVRRVEPRNTPTMINAVFNHRNFWDMRAQHLFNGVNPFGDRDPNATLYKATDRLSPELVRVLIDNSSLASQAVGPPTNRFEMSADGRTFPEVADRLMRELRRSHRGTARRLLLARPLALQLVDRTDSLLGPHSRAPLRGLSLTYEALIRAAFQKEWWDSPRFIQVDEATGATRVVNARDTNPANEEYTLLEYNFSLFFGLAVQAYEATLVSDDTPFDRFLAGREPLSPEADRGRRIFYNENTAPAPRGNCAFCHSGSLLSEASVEVIKFNADLGAPEGGMIRTGAQVSDRGTRSIGVRETADDLGNGGLDPFGNSLSVAVRVGGGALAADGTFKIPSLRNVELTAPFFHTGGEATLADVVTFYARGGNLGGGSNPIRTRDGTTIVGLSVLTTILNADDPEAVKADLVAFLEALTDDRVRRAAAPFDHPQIFVPNGHPGNSTSVVQLNGRAVDTFLEIPATGQDGGPILPGFLEDD